MKILVRAVIKVDPKKRTSALSEATDLIKQALAEPGCLAYNWSADPQDPSAIHVFEEWQNQGDFALHLKAPSFFGISELLSNQGLIDAQARKFLIQAEDAIYDSSGSPSARFS